MTRSIPLIAVLVFATGCSQKTEQSGVNRSMTSVSFNTAGAPTVEFSLPDMMCEDGCAVAVKDILEKQPGVQDVRVDFEAKTATVAIDDASFSSERTLAELVDKGFDNSQLKNDATASDEGASPPTAVN
jgi:copper chaperone CopZ